MGNLSDARPKCLSVLAGKALLDWQLEALRGAGIEDIAIVRGYLGEQIARPGVAYFENPRWMRTNMVVSLTCAARWLETQTCVVGYADIVYPSSTVTKLASAAGEIVIAYDIDWLRLWSLRFADPLSDAETFRVDESGRLTEIGDRAASVAEIMGQYLGLLRFSPVGWSAAKVYLAELSAAGRDRLDMTALLKGLIAGGVPISTVPVCGECLEVDSPKDLELYERLAASQDGRLWPLG